MLQAKGKLAGWKIVFVFAFMAMIIGIPYSTISAKTTSTPRDWLKKTIDYCTKLDKSDYTSASWTALQKEVKEATAIYKKTKIKDSEYSAARDELEASKANLMFTASKDNGNPLPMRELTVAQMVDEMGTGWNLGNTMDGHTGFTPNETTWQSIVTTKEFIKEVHDAGFNTIRVPVTWGTKIDDTDGYSIDEAWISRVQDIVDYCVSQDMYVIINLHHDGAEQMGWIRVSADDIDPVYEKFEKVWRNIAERFKDYDEHLIFESMNEVTGDGKTTMQHDIQVIMNLNQIFVNTVRATGSNNTGRWLSVPGRYTNIDTSTDKTLGFDLPKDTIANHIFVSVHHYDVAFGLTDTMNSTTWSAHGNSNLSKLLNKIVTRFTSKGIPVILGEYGAMNKNNTPDRTLHYEAVSRISQQDGIVPCVWDSGDYNSKLKPDYTFSLFDRKTLKCIYPEIVDAIMRGEYLTGSTDLKDIVKSPKINKISDITLNDTELNMTIGDNKKVTTQVKPANTNDVVLWKTSDPSIATVSNGNVRARGIGTTTIIAFSQSGSVEKVLTVVVNKKSSANPCTSIVTSKDTYDLVKGQYVYLNAELKPSNTEDYATYKSSNEAIAKVSTLGKIVACSEGTAYITITASNGLTKTVKVNVAKSGNDNELSIALNVYYNDNTLSYFANETGKAITITEDGQYTLTFDTTADLSANAKKAGVKTLSNMTAIYIKDHEVSLGKADKSPLTACLITYDKILVNGSPLTITKKDAKSAIKSSGIFDTNDPLNAWDGSAVKEAKSVNHVLNFDGISNPTKIEVTFTISGLKFKGDENSTGKVTKPVAATAIAAGIAEPVVLSKVGDSIDISALVTPANATTGVTFVSSDASVAAVNTSAAAIDPKTGKATVKVLAMSAGKATITAYTAEGFTTTFEVTVGN